MHQNHLFRAHPWHGMDIGEMAPSIVNCYIEMVPIDTVKYELDKETGILKVDRPQKYSSLCPTLYGLLPRTYAGELVGNYCSQKTGLKNIKGDGDPLDICVLTEKVIPRGDIMLKASVIGGFRLIDKNEADDKIIAVLYDDFVFGKMKTIHECPNDLIERLRHYFLTYKDAPGRESGRVQITDIYDREEAETIISLSLEDYKNNFKLH
ncbi:inorganic pyrophosphatase [Criblamydia sequanensis]|uniref:inorganic diphosphatase n=1 Tax=Candidatus Criblamydia sequanensis CRIB-18 TaxID=1437425 RepID=A0A090D0B8_9BACT|nr:inorganic pyrophosphatase [Criblamydia sequanensis]CDR34731.1 Inorganic pyrophosphatase [Criblamydia sequanensis CRIB-18]